MTLQPPGGESLKDTVARTLPYFVQEILPRVLQWRAHARRRARQFAARAGHGAGAPVTPEGIVKRELATGVPIIYRLNADCDGRPRKLDARGAN